MVSLGGLSDDSLDDFELLAWRAGRVQETKKAPDQSLGHSESIKR